MSPQVNLNVREVLHDAATNQLVAEVLFLNNPNRGKSTFAGFLSDGLLLSPVKPNSLRSRIQELEPLVIWFEFRGALHWIFSRVVRVIMPDRLFVLRMPDVVNRLQRRSGFRVTPSKTNPALIRSFSKCRDVRSIAVKDISLKGVCIVFPNNPIDCFQNNSADFSIDLGQFGALNLSGLLKTLRRLPEGSFQAGLEFKNLMVRAEAILSDYLNARQRESLSKRSHG
jgi:c-di-GMP-binding flagellar brake protein YcgR